MNNPWLDVPLADYEGHMSLPGIEQAQLLSDLLAGALAAFTPLSVAVIGCAGGNGFERIPPSVARVVGVDLNPRYIAATEARFGSAIADLELVAGDIQSDEVAFAPVDLVFCGLIFEYVDAEVVMRKMPGMLASPGHLVTVLQLPAAGHQRVSPSPFHSVRSVGEVMHLLPPRQLRELAEAQGYVQLETRTVVSGGGKSFRVQSFGRPPGPAVHADATR